MLPTSTDVVVVVGVVLTTDGVPTDTGGTPVSATDVDWAVVVTTTTGALLTSIVGTDVTTGGVGGVFTFNTGVVVVAGIRFGLSSFLRGVAVVAGAAWVEVVTLVTPLQVAAVVVLVSEALTTFLTSCVLKSTGVLFRPLLSSLYVMLDGMFLSGSVKVCRSRP